MYSPIVYMQNKPIFQLRNVNLIAEVIDQISEYIGLLPTDFYLTYNGKKLSQISDIGRIDINIRVYGGKGGFGSMLRAIGAQIEKTTNREACRDLSGRRLRDINEEKRLKSWLDKQKDRDAEAKERKRKKLEKLMSVPKHEFKDSEYESIRAEMTENVSDAVEEGFKKAALATQNNAKRKANDSGTSKPKKAALWIDDDISSSSDTDDESVSDVDVAKNMKSKLENSSTSRSSEDAGEGSSKMSKDSSEDATPDLKNSIKDDNNSSSSGGSAIEK